MDLKPTADALVKEVFPDARIVDTHRLAGGISADTRRVDLVDASGTEHSLTVRRTSDDDTNSLTPPATVDLLHHVRAHGVPAPRPRAADRSHLVLDFARGSPRLGQRELIDLAQEMARVLAGIHAVGEPPVKLVDRTAFVGRHLISRSDALDTSLREPEIIEAVRAVWPPPPCAPTLLHGDFWPGNLVWSGAGIAAVVDWEDASIGDPHADVSIARLDLRWASGAEAAAGFTTAYDQISQIDARRLAIWDLVAAGRPSGTLDAWASTWPALGRPDVTVETMRARHSDFLDEALAALNH